MTINQRLVDLESKIRKGPTALNVPALPPDLAAAIRRAAELIRQYPMDRVPPAIARISRELALRTLERPGLNLAGMGPADLESLSPSQLTDRMAALVRDHEAAQPSKGLAP